MGTRSLTVFLDEEGKEIVVMYRQFDGYPAGHGLDLADLLRGYQIVNGISFDHSPKIANGLGCLAATVVAHFKKGPGGFYLHPAGTRDCGEEYVYYVSGKVNEEPRIRVMDARWDRDTDKIIEIPMFESYASGYTAALAEFDKTRDEG